MDLARRIDFARRIDRARGRGPSGAIRRPSGDPCTWEAFAEATRALNRLDERNVIEAALRGAARLFRPDRAEVVVPDAEGRPRHYFVRPTEAGDGYDASRLKIREGHRAGPDATEPATLLRRRLVVGAVEVGELCLGYARKVRLSGRQQHAFSAYADAVSSALHDATTHRQLRAMTARSAYETVHDSLTGLHNRSMLLAKGNAVLRRLAPDTPVALALLDVDGFKEVNDALGHAAGDELLRALGGRLAQSIVEGELVGRLGGDEFALLMVPPPAPEPEGPTPGTDELITARARAVTAELARPVPIAGVTLAVEVSAGVGVMPAGAGDLAELLRRADVALSQAKRSGTGVVSYDAATDGASVDRLALLAELRDALATTDEIMLELQPMVDLASGRPWGAEALVRWRHPRRGLLHPADFLAVVEQSDLVGGFTWYVLDQALRIAARWIALGLDAPISVNISARSLADRGLPEMVADRLAARGVPADRLIVEITEQVLAAEPVAVVDVIAALRGVGVRVSVDDFGTGYSSLAFMTRVPVDGIKIDRTFVSRMSDSAEAAAIVRATVDLARDLGLRVVAEGVEMGEHRTALGELGVTSAQGFLFHPAMGEDEVTALLQSGIMA